MKDLFNRTDKGILFASVIMAVVLLACTGVAAGNSGAVGGDEFVSQQPPTIPESDAVANSPPGAELPDDPDADVPDPVRVGNATGNISTSDTPVIQGEILIDRTPSNIGEITVTYEVEMPENVLKFYAYPPDSASVTSTDFSYDSSREMWETSSPAGTESRASLTYSIEVNKTSNSFGGFETVETPDWALLDRSQIRVGEFYRYNSPRPTYKENISVDGPGYVTDSSYYAFLGPVNRLQNTTSGQTITLVVPDAAEPRRAPSTLLNDLTKSSEFLEIGERDPQVTGIIAPEPIRGGGLAIGNSFWAQEDSVGTTHIHEYVHTRQGWGRNSTLEWTIEGSADYYAGYLAWELLDIYDERRFYRHASTSIKEDSVLQDEDSESTEQKNYHKGRRVLTALDLRIRQHTDGNRTLQTVFKRLNAKEGRVSYTDFRNEAISLTDESTGPWLDEYVQTSSAPSIPVSIGAAYSGECLTVSYDGDGTDTNPFRISNVDQLRCIGTGNRSLDASYEVVSDIDASETESWNDGKGFSPIGISKSLGSENDPEFNGVFDGSGYKIKNLTINRIEQGEGFFIGEGNIGMFGAVGSSGKITNVSVVDADIGGNFRVGGLVGENNGTVSRSYVTGEINGTSFAVGGLIGRNEEEGIISKSYSRASINSRDAGGLVGRNFGTVSETYATGDINASLSAGGLIDGGLGGTIEKSYWDKESTGQSRSDGGTGLTTSEMTGDDATGNMSGFDFIDTWVTVPGDYPRLILEKIPPTASFTLSPNRPTVGESVTFDATGSNDPDGSIRRYEWDYGDGNTATATGETVTHTYSNPGTYTVELIVTDDGGKTETTTRTVTVDEDPMVIVDAIRDAGDNPNAIERQSLQDAIFEFVAGDGTFNGVELTREGLQGAVFEFVTN